MREPKALNLLCTLLTYIYRTFSINIIYNILWKFNYISYFSRKIKLKFST